MSTGFTERSFTGWNGCMDHRANAAKRPLAIYLAALEWERNTTDNVISDASIR